MEEEHPMTATECSSELRETEIYYSSTSSFLFIESHVIPILQTEGKNVVQNDQQEEEQEE